MAKKTRKKSADLFHKEFIAAIYPLLDDLGKKLVVLGEVTVRDGSCARSPEWTKAAEDMNIILSRYVAVATLPAEQLMACVIGHEAAQICLGGRFAELAGALAARTGVELGDAMRPLASSYAHREVTVACVPMAAYRPAPGTEN